MIKKILFSFPRLVLIPIIFVIHKTKSLFPLKRKKALDNSESDLQLFIELVIESWRFSKNYLRIITNLEVQDSKRYLSQYNYFQKVMIDILNKKGLKIINLEGQEYDPGMAATPINIGEFNEDSLLFVEQMIEPIIMGEKGIVKTGVMLLKGVEK